GENELGEAVHAPRLLALDPLGRIEVLHLAGEVNEVVSRVELRDGPCARLARKQALPGSLGIVPERSDRPDARDDDSPMTVDRQLHPQSAVDEQHLARDKRSLVGAQETYRAGDVLRPPEPAERGV